METIDTSKGIFTKTSKFRKDFRCLASGIILFEGLIGVGKSTLTKSIYKFLKKVGLKVKLFREFVDENLLGQYISDMTKYSYTFQIAMAIKRIETYKHAINFTKTGGIAIMDRSLPGDYAFALMQKQNNNIVEEEWKVYNSLIKTAVNTEPSIIVNLKAPPKVAFDRMIGRNRKGEKDGYTLSYFEDLNKAYEKVMENVDVPVMNLDWDRTRKLDDTGELKDECCAEVLYLVRDQILGITR